MRFPQYQSSYGSGQKNWNNKAWNKHETGLGDTRITAESEQTDGTNILDDSEKETQGRSKPVQNWSRLGHRCHNHCDRIRPELSQNERISNMTTARSGSVSSPAIFKRECQRKSSQRCDADNLGRLDVLNWNLRQYLNARDTLVLIYD